MMLKRRDLLSLLGATPTLLAGCTAASQETKTNPPAESVADQETFDFWARQVRDPESFDKSGTNGARGLGSAPRATLIYYDPMKGFLTGSDIGDEGLPDKGNLDVVINVDHIRPSTQDQSRFENLEGGSLRIDVQQAQPLPSLTERLAWTALAGFLPDNKKLPPLQEMQFSPGTTWGDLKTVPLPGGGGRWTWNFFLKKRQSRWMQIFDVIRKNANLAIPVFGLGLPAIAITALNTVDKIVAEITKDEQTEWLFQSPDAHLYSTKEARDAFVGTKLRLKEGMYVVMPSEHAQALGKEKDKLIIKDGLIVPKETSGLDVFEAAKQTIPTVTYLTVGVKATLKPA